MKVNSLKSEVVFVRKINENYETVEERELLLHIHFFLKENSMMINQGALLKGIVDP